MIRVRQQLTVFELGSRGQPASEHMYLDEIKAIEKIIGPPYETWHVYMRDGSEFFTQTQHVVEAYDVPICPTTPPRSTLKVGQWDFSDVEEIWATKPFRRVTCPSMDVKKLVGRNVRAIRRNLGWSQEELSFNADLHRTYISGIERGARNPTVVVLAKVAAALRVPPSRLLEELRDDGKVS